jgi:hypothetical protein
MPKRFLAFALVALLAGGAVAQRPPAATFEPEAEDPTTFPDFPGRDEAFAYCIACHGFKIVAQQGLTRDQWEGSLNWMTERHGMAELEPADRTIVLDYLVKAFPPRAPTGGRGGWSNPFLPK